MLFFVVLAILSFVFLTTITIAGVLKYSVSELLYPSQLLCGFIGATAAAYVKALVYSPQAFYVPVFLLEWVEMLLAVYAWGWLVWYLTSTVQLRLETKLEQRRWLNQ